MRGRLVKEVFLFALKITTNNRVVDVSLVFISDHIVRGENLWYMRHALINAAICHSSILIYEFS